MFKYIKRLLGKRNNTGFTLVEVVVSVALLGVMILGVLGFMAPVLASVAEKKENARAVMLMEAIDSYITNSVRYAKYMKIYTNVKIGTDPTAGDSDFSEMTSKVDALHELRCFSFNWKATGVQNEYKLVLRQNKVNQSTFKIETLPSGEPNSIDVMGDCAYEGLNIVPKISLIDNNYDVPDPLDPSNTVPKYPVGDPELRYIGFQNITQVYRDKRCYSTSEEYRSTGTLAYVGQSYTTCTTIASTFSNKKTGSAGYVYKIYETSEGTYDLTGVDSSNIWEDDNGDEYYYPETYVYYVVRKLDA